MTTAKTITTGINLNDNSYHLVKFSRHGNLINLKIDDIPPVTTEILTRNWEMHFDQLTVGSATNPFSGKINHLLINNENYLKSKNTLVSMATVTDYIGFPQLRIYSHGDIYLSFRTSQKNGLLFYNGGVSDPVSMEMHGGKLVLSYGGEKIETRKSFHDDKWHFVKISFDYLRGVKIEVDWELQGEGGCNGEFLRLSGVLYVGMLFRCYGVFFLLI